MSNSKFQGFMDDSRFRLLRRVYFAVSMQLHCRIGVPVRVEVLLNTDLLDAKRGLLRTSHIGDFVIGVINRS